MECSPPTHGLYSCINIYMGLQRVLKGEEAFLDFFVNQSNEGVTAISNP